jgi:hypothetical protein
MLAYVEVNKKYCDAQSDEPELAILSCLLTKEFKQMSHE